MVKLRELFQQDRCLAPKSLEVFKVMDYFHDVYFVGERAVAKVMLAVPGISELVNRLWYSEKALSFQYSTYIYYNKEKRNLGRILISHIENGMMDRIYRCIDESSRVSARRSGIALFESIEDYIQAFSTFSDLEISNFQYIFIYGLICSLIFVAFCMHHLVNFVKKKNITLSSLRDSYTRFAYAVRIKLIQFYRRRFVCS